VVHITNTYWNTLLVNIDKIREEWSDGKNYANKLKLFLMGNNVDNRKKYVDYIYPNNEINKEDVDNHYDEILAKLNAKYLQGLREFLIGKSGVIEEYVANNSSLFTSIEIQTPLLALIKMFGDDPSILTSILLMKIWNSKSIDETFLFTQTISDEQINQLIEDMPNIVAAIKRKNKGRYEYKGKRFFNNDHIFWLEKQSSDKMRRAFSKNIRFKPSSDILFNIDYENNLLELKCGNNSLIDTISSIIARKLSLSLFYYHKENCAQLNLINFKNALSIIPEQVSENEFGICEIGFNRMKISNSAPLVIPKRSGRDIRKTLNELDNEEIIDLKDIESIDYLKVLYNDSDRKIKFKANKDGTLTLKLDTRNLSRSKIDKINLLFEEKFGVPLDKSISETDERKILENTYNLIFSSDIIDKTSNVIKLNLQKLKDKELINYNGNKIYWCVSCKRTFSEVENCPDCGDPLKFILSKVNISRNPTKILNFIKNKFINSGYDVKIRLIQRTYLGKKKNFIYLSYDKEVIYLYFNDGENIKHMIEYFKHSNIPIIIINNSKRKLKDFDQDIFPQISLAKLLVMSNEEFKTFFDELLERVKEKIENVLIQSADNSSDRLNSYLTGTQTSYDATMLEDDTYNLMRYIFKTGEKWGKAVSGTTVPEGIIGYGYLKQMGSQWNKYLRSMIWDCKFTQGEQFDFSRYVKIQARDYVIRTSQSKAIKDHSQQLSVYINFTNNVNQTQYNNFAKKVKNIEDWNGKVVLFELSALNKLFKLIKRNYSEIDSRRSQLYHKLTLLMNKQEKDKFYSLITETKINNLMTELLQSKRDIPQLDYEETFLWLESDTIRIRG